MARSFTRLASLADVRPDPRNPNRGTRRGQAALAHSLGTLGAGRSILVDRYGQVIAGHKVLTEARTLDPALADHAYRGDALVAVQRLDLDLTRRTHGARQLALADNRVAELGLEWDEAALRALVARALTSSRSGRPTNSPR